MTTSRLQSPSRATARKRSNRSKIVAAIVMVLCALLGVGILLYPVVATQMNNWEQSKLARQFSDDSSAVSPEQAAAALAEARAFDEAHTGVSLEDPWSSGVPTESEAYQQYLKVLDDFPAMGQIAIPSINVNLPIYHGTSDTTLLKGVGHLFGTALPLGGEGRRTVLTAHSGIESSTFFDNLEDVQVGDAIFIRNIGETLKYEVRDTEVILPGQLDRLVPEEGRDLVTLVTCTPYGINTHRLLVTAERVDFDPAEAEQALGGDALVWQWWMKLAIGAALALILLMILGAFRLVRKRRRTTPERGVHES
ncbi:class C sortase [Corynebacterium striatum]